MARRTVKEDGSFGNSGKGRDESVNKRLNAFRIDNTIANSGTDTAIENASQVRWGTSRAFGNACKYLTEF